MTTNREKTLSAMPGTCQQLAERLQLSYPATCRHVAALHDAKQAHVGDWSTPAGRGAPGAIYHAGPGDDVPCPYNRTMNKRGAQVKTGSVPARDPLTAAFFGSVAP